MILGSIVFATFFLTIILIGYLISAPGYKGPVSDHFNGKKFNNPTGIKSQGLIAVLKWAMNRDKGVWRELKEIKPYDKPPYQVESGLRITFVNHSTFLIQLDGINFLTDPVWSQRVSPFSFIGPKRMRPPGIDFDDLPRIDVILLSHNHYDHLDIPTLKRITQKHKPKIITPLGVRAFLEKKGIAATGDLDWWDEIKISKNLTIVATPAQHFSSRGMFDRDTTLWCGYVIKRNGGNIYFVGDTGYNDKTFKEIGERCYPIKVGLIPIGAYKPEWFMSPIHCSPKEAVQIHHEIKAEQSIAMHFGTFPLADEGEDDPLLALEEAQLNSGSQSKSFLTLKEGEAKSFN